MIRAEGDALAVGLDESPGRAVRLARRQGEKRSPLQAVPIPSKKGQGLEPILTGDVKSTVFIEGEGDWQRYFERAAACIDNGEYHLAIALLVRVVKHAENHVEAWHRLGFAYSELGRSDRAIESFNNVIRLVPTRSEAWANRGWNRIRLGEHRLAVADLLRAVDLDHDSAIAWSNLGLAYVRLNSFEKAAEAYEQATIADPGNEYHCYNLAKILSSQGEKDAAILFFGRACEINPQFLAARLQLLLRNARPLEMNRVEENTKTHSSTASTLPNIGRILRRESYMLNTPLAETQSRLLRLWAFVQNPVAWILVLVVAALLYIALGN